MGPFHFLHRAAPVLMPAAEDLAWFGVGFGREDAEVGDVELDVPAEDVPCQGQGSRPVDQIEQGRVFDDAAKLVDGGVRRQVTLLPLGVGDAVDDGGEAGHILGRQGVFDDEIALLVEEPQLLRCGAVFENRIVHTGNVVQSTLTVPGARG